MQATFAGANIKGTPSMRASSVIHDMRILMKTAGVFVVQEYRWKWYWTAANMLMAAAWGSYPRRKAGIGNPVKGGQAIFWKRALFEKIDEYVRPAFTFEKDNSGIMENRWIRAVLLKNKKGKFQAWFITTHFVVGGDEESDGPRRKDFMEDNLDRFDEALTHLQNSGFPIMGELDANIHKNTWAYKRFMAIMRKHGATLHGAHGVEYAFTINGRYGTWTYVKDDIIPTSRLKTDHEVRVLYWHGVPREKETA